MENLTVEKIVIALSIAVEAAQAILALVNSNELGINFDTEEEFFEWANSVLDQKMVCSLESLMKGPSLLCGTTSKMYAHHHDF